MARCGCTSAAECGCAAGVSDCVAMSGVGSLADPFVPVLVLSEDAGNNAECRDDGLYVPSAILALAEGTTDQNTITSADLTGLSFTITVLAGHKIRLSYFEPNPSGSLSPDAFSFRIQEGATILQDGNFVVPNANVHNRIVNLSRVLSPSAASHSYKVAVARTSGTGTISLDRSATSIAYFLAEDLGVL